MTPLCDDEDTHDPLLAELFRAANPPLADAGFSDAVLWRLRRRARIRETVLGLAAAAGIALALMPSSRLLATCSERLAITSLEWSGSVQQRLQRVLPDSPIRPG